MRKTVNLTYVVALLSFIVLCQQLWVPGFFHDGYIYAALGKNAATLSNWLVPHLSDVTYSRFNHHPPLYFMIEGLFFKLFGSDWIQARLFGVLWVMLWLFGMRKLFKGELPRSSRDLFILLLLLIPDIMKKGRFPNLDFALSLCCAFALLIIYRNPRTRNWLISGFLLGLGFWFKGLSVLIFGVVFTFYLLWRRELLRKSGPYLCVLVFLIVGGLWPLLLKVTGNWDVFLGYLEMQFFQTALQGRGEAMPFYTYAFHIAKVMPHILLLIIWGAWSKGKTYWRDPATVLGAIWFFSGFIVLSLMKFKYSHYLIPYYPGLALMALPAMLRLREKAAQRFDLSLGVLTMIAGLLLLSFPLTTRSSRHIELLQMEEGLKWRGLSPQQFYLIDDTYEFWSTTNYVAYRFSKTVSPMSSQNLDIPAESVVLVSPASEGKILERYQGELLYRNQRVSILYIDKK